MSNEAAATRQYVGTIVGESTSGEFRLAVAQEAIREQDIIAVDAELRARDGKALPEQIRVWAKVKRIERYNPLFPVEAGHELAATQTDPFDTVLSLSREMVSAVCQVLGSEPMEAETSGKLAQLRYPPKPAASAYAPDRSDIVRIVVGDLNNRQESALDVANLSNRPDVDVKVDGHAIVTRHLAVLAMTGAGKTWAVRRVLEELAKKNYPMVIFDPRGDYTGLGDLPELKNRVKRYYAQFPVFDEDADTIMNVVSNLGYKLTDTMVGRFSDLFQAARSFLVEDEKERREREKWLSNLLPNSDLKKYGIKPDLWLIANLAEAAEYMLRDAPDSQANIQQLSNWCWPNLPQYGATDKRTLEGIKKRVRKAASTLRRMEQVSKQVAGQAEPLPTDKTDLVQYGGISIIALAGYTGEFQATICSMIADKIFDARVTNKLEFPVLMVLEEAHNFVPAKANNPAEERSIATIRQIAQEGRKFRVGLVLISQRPSRLDETTLSMCNSFIIMRMVNPADQNFVRKVMETLGEDDARMLPDLDKGEALLSGQMINFPVLVKMKKPDSQGEREEEDAFKMLEEDRKRAAKNKTA